MDNEVAKNIKSNTLKTKENNLEMKIPDATTLIRGIQYNTDKQNLEKNIGDVDRKDTRCKWFSDYNCFEYKN